MEKKYLIRLDDACPTMSLKKWGRMEALLDKYGVAPMVGIIPHNEDPKQMVDDENPHYWIKVESWIKKEWAIALHGYNHVYSSEDGLKGLNPMWKKSEFAGVALNKQKEKIRQGVQILNEHGIDPQYFFAPSHTFDKNTLLALKDESNIRIISDCISLHPYQKDDIIYIPQLFGHCVKMPFAGVYTFCFHPNTMNDRTFDQLEQFLAANKEYFVKWQTVDLKCVGEKRIIDHLISFVYFAYRKVRGLR